MPGGKAWPCAFASRPCCFQLPVPTGSNQVRSRFLSKDVGAEMQADNLRSMTGRVTDDGIKKLKQMPAGEVAGLFDGTAPSGALAYASCTCTRGIPGDEPVVFQSALAASRQSQSLFRCTTFGYWANADTNAALNILALGMASANGRGAYVRPAVRGNPAGGHSAMKRQNKLECSFHLSM